MQPEVSEAILKQFALRHSLTANAINDLIKDVLKNTAFNKDEVDTDMLQRLQASINRGDVDIINMHTELFMRPVQKVLRELMADIRLAGCQHLHFTSTRTSVATDVLQGPQQISIFQLAKYKLGKALFQCQLCSTLMAHISRKGFLFDLFSISVCISYLISCMMSYQI